MSILCTPILVHGMNRSQEGWLRCFLRETNLVLLNLLNTRIAPYHQSVLSNKVKLLFGWYNNFVFNRINNKYIINQKAASLWLKNTFLQHSYLDAVYLPSRSTQKSMRYDMTTALKRFNICESATMSEWSSMFVSWTSSWFCSRVLLLDHQQNNYLKNEQNNY